LNLALDIRVEVYLLDFWEAQKVNRTGVPSRWILGDELSQRLIKVLCDEWCVGGLGLWLITLVYAKRDQPTHHSAAESEQCLEERVQSRNCVLLAIFAL